jgi:hypothetical protein
MDARLGRRNTEWENHHEFTNNGEWTPDARHQTSAEKGRETTTNYTNGEENIFLH